uniref:Uncharacterized protein n=1 Tax=Branchiostoma floridae TaxID=7739 RepID=C3YEW0_BRAFL|eukprot:XP_002605194.1 hypothetical protein BRAFLDRAFT_80864 [Branchiostoma floridae]
MSCKGSDVKISETKRMCHSVLTIPVADNTTAGNYTCRVATNYTESATASVVLTISNATSLPDNVVTTGLENTDGSTAKTTTVMYIILLHGEDNWNESGLSVKVVIYTGLVTFFCCCVMFGLAICFIKRRSASNEDGGHGNTVEVHYENADQFSDADGTEEENRHYESNDQHPDSNNDTNRHYENNDQFPGLNDDTNRHYENDDQFPDLNNDANRHDENADGNEDLEEHYENDDQVPDTNQVTVGHYENDDQVSSEFGATVRSEENGDQFSDEEGTLGRHYDNKIGTESFFKASPPYEAPAAVQELTSALYKSDSTEEQQDPIVEVEGHVTDN